MEKLVEIHYVCVYCIVPYGTFVYWSERNDRNSFSYYRDKRETLTIS